MVGLVMRSASGAAGSSSSTCKADDEAMSAAGRTCRQLCTCTTAGDAYVDTHARTHTRTRKPSAPFCTSPGAGDGESKSSRRSAFCSSASPAGTGGEARSVSEVATNTGTNSSAKARRRVATRLRNARQRGSDSVSLFREVAPYRHRPSDCITTRGAWSMRVRTQT